MTNLRTEIRKKIAEITGCDPQDNFTILEEIGKGQYKIMVRWLQDKKEEMVVSCIEV
jgi:hypothetical protein